MCVRLCMCIYGDVVILQQDSLLIYSIDLGEEGQDLRKEEVKKEQ